MSGFLKKPRCNAYALLRSVSIAVRAMYSISTLRVKPLTVLRSFLAAWRMSSASSAVQRMRMDDLVGGMWRVQRRNLRQDSAASVANARDSCTLFLKSLPWLREGKNARLYDTEARFSF